MQFYAVGEFPTVYRGGVVEDHGRGGDVVQLDVFFVLVARSRVVHYLVDDDGAYEGICVGVAGGLAAHEDEVVVIC